MIYDYPFTSHYLEIEGGRLHYLDEGSGPVVTMLHGNPTWSYYYRHLVRALSPHFRVIVPDHMGCGLSDKPENYPYCLEQHIANLTLLLNTLKIDYSSLIVHDWGGAIGMGFATRMPERIKRLVVLNTAAFRSRQIPFRIRICTWPIIGALLVKGLNGFARSAVISAVKKPLDKKVKAAYLAPYDSWRNRIALHAFVQDIPLTPRHRSYKTLEGIEEGLANLNKGKKPMFILWGGKDFCFNDSFYNVWRHRFPEAEYCYLQEAGHYVLEDGHGVVEPLIEAFLRKQL